MKPMEFTAGSCIRFGWETFKKRPWFFIGAFFLYVLVVGVVSGSLTDIGKAGPSIGFLTFVVNILFQLIAGMGMVAFLLKAHDDVERVELKDFWHPQTLWYYLGASVLVCLIVVGGLILLIVPGIIWAIMYGFAPYLVIDKGLRPMEAMQESKRITMGHKWTLFRLAVLSILVVLLGFVCLIFGVFVAIPVVALAKVRAMRELQRISGTLAGAM